ncbi:hypothetical protein ES703_44383 [subsurface metagenome]
MLNIVVASRTITGAIVQRLTSFFDLHIVSDGYGGALVSWLASASSQQPEYTSHVTSVDSEGNVRWQREVRGVDHMISDGAGGAIIATDYSYDEETLFIIKIDANGRFPWGEDGVSVRREGYCDSLQLTGDGNGGAIFVWQERKGEPGKKTTHIFAQRINYEGNLSWGQEGVLLYTTPEEVSAEEPRITSDGSGGAIVVWVQMPEGIIEEGSPEALLFDIHAQRVDARGNVLWAPNGIPLEIHKSAGFPYNPLIVSDGASGTIVLWGGPMGMYAQKIDADGNMEWRPGGVEVTGSSPNNAISDSSGGVIVTFGCKEAETKKSRLCVQRIDADGRTIWPGDGTGVTEHGTHAISSDGQGGAVIAWGIGKDMFSSKKSYVQRISADGKLLWGDKGIRLNP